MKKFVLLLALLTLLVPAAVMADGHGCGVEAPEEAADVTFIGWTFPILDFYAEVIEGCDEVDNIDVTIQLLSSGDAQEQMRLAASSEGDSPYDIVHGSNNFINEIADTGWLLPLNDLIDEYADEYGLTDDIAQALYDAASIDGNIYGIPIVVNTQHFYYNTELYEAAGIEAPATYDELIASCDALAGVDDVDFPFALVVSAGWAWRIEFLNILGSYGGAPLDEDLNPTFNSEEGVAAAEKLLEVADACMGEDGLLLSTDDVQAGLQNGSIASAHLWASRGTTVDDEEQSDVIGLIEFAPALYAEEGQEVRGAIGYSDFLAIPASTTQDVDLLFRIIMEAADTETQLAAGAFGLTARTSAADGAPRNAEASFATITEGGPAQSAPIFGVVNAALGEFLPMIATGEMTAQEALDAAADKYVEEATAQGFIE